MYRDKKDAEWERMKAEILAEGEEDISWAISDGRDNRWIRKMINGMRNELIINLIRR